MDGFTVAEHVVPFSATSFSNAQWSSEEYPDMAANANDWAFQGVDRAFFDSLMSNNKDIGDGILQ